MSKPKRNLAALLGLLLLAPTGIGSAEPAETLSFGRFGAVTLVHPASQPRHVVLFFSGGEGWGSREAAMAQALAGMDALVAGIDTRHYLGQLAAGHEKCAYPAGDLESLSQLVQKKLGLPAYETPVLAGSGPGATLAYAALVQAPPNTYLGALSFGFCPELPFSRPLCPGHHALAGVPGRNGTTLLRPAPQLEAPWVAFQGEEDAVCGKAATVKYTAQMRSAEVVLLPGVGRGLGPRESWEPQLRQAFQRLVGNQGAPPAAGKLTGLPVVEVPAHGQGGDTLAVVLSGDGGWAGLDREVAGGLAERGIPVVGLNSLQYFWTARTPDGTARDLERILRHYLPAWHRDKAILIGYSFGADVLPFAVSRLPADLQERIRLVALLAPGHKATFEFHVGDWLGLDDSGLPILPEVKKLAGRPLLCLYGRDEDPKESLCPEISPPLGRSMALEGGHHFGGGHQVLADLILRSAAGSPGRR